MFHDAQYDLITLSQALHRLDDVMVCRGVSRLLRPGGSFVVVLGAMTVPDTHPLSFILGDHSLRQVHHASQTTRPRTATASAVRPSRGESVASERVVLENGDANSGYPLVARAA